MEELRVHLVDFVSALERNQDKKNAPNHISNLILRLEILFK
jgi:hypothetical protein